MITENKIEQLRKGVQIGVKGEKYITKPGKAFCIEDPNFPLRSQKIRDERHGPTSWISIIIKEGKFRQVRKMTAAVNLPTLRLIRVRVGDIKLGELKSKRCKRSFFFSIVLKLYTIHSDVWNSVF